jgi:AcrR family transcriptional regulator
MTNLRDFSGEDPSPFADNHPARDCRDRLIGATLNLCTGRGYEATTVDQIAAAAGLTPRDFARYFATKDAVLMSIVDDVLEATAVALRSVDAAASPEQALLIATTAVLTAIIEGRGVITRARMHAIAPIIGAQPNLRRQASLARKRVLAPAVADRMGLGAENPRVRRAVSMWSAIAAIAEVGSRSMTAYDDLRQDDRLSERVAAQLAAIFAEVMGKAPWEQV